ncbi:MAG: hypothetical protein HY040_14525 [Planctomycetes bacterium]|nr:hypothetical protein [Planctomycetota bacterium]
MRCKILRIAAVLGVLGFISWAAAQDSSSPVKITVKDGKVQEAAEVSLPIDPAPRIQPGYSGGNYFGLTLEGKRISCSPQGSIWATARVDNQEIQPGLAPGIAGRVEQPKLLPPGPHGKKRLGTQYTWKEGNLQFTQVIEIVPSKPGVKAAPGQKRRLDTARISYLVENKDSKEHVVEFRTGIDILINNNDGALFASPTTHPGKVLDGVMLKDEALPEFIQVLENPDVKNPIFTATMTLKFRGKTEGPNKIVMTSLGAFGGGWDIPAQQAGGDSACALYWPAKSLKPGEKREMVWAYGGGVASSPENEGKVSVSLGGSFEPGKQFTVMASVEDPAPGQTLTLELPAGLERIEGKERQPVPDPQETGSSVVMWKGRVTQMGNFQLRIRSSTGVVQSKNITIQPAN